MNKKLILLLVTAFVALASLVVLINNYATPFGLLMGAFSITSFSLLLYASLPKLLHTLSRNQQLELNKPLASLPLKKRIQTWISIGICVVLFEQLLIVAAYVIADLSGVYDGSFFGTLERIWCYSGIDAPSYLGIAENWYVTTGDPQYHIVFFPFFAILIRFFQFFVRDYLLAAMLVSSLMSVGVGIAAYELASFDSSKKDSLFFTCVTFIFPAAFFFFAPMTESTFVFLSLLTFILLRKRFFLPAALVAALAAFTRSPGVLLALPIAIEYVESNKETYQKRPLKVLLCAACFAAVAALGLIAYLLINLKVWGDPFKFSQFQREHWNQGMGFFFGTAQYMGSFLQSAIDAIQKGDNIYRYLSLIFGLYIPALITVIGTPVFVTLAAKRLRTSYLWYFIAYFLLTMGATWLLSAPRYMAASVVLPLSVALLCSSKCSKIIAAALLVLLFAAYFIAYVIRFPVY